MDENTIISKHNHPSSSSFVNAQLVIISLLSFITPTTANIMYITVWRSRLQRDNLPFDTKCEFSNSEDSHLVENAGNDPATSRWLMDIYHKFLYGVPVNKSIEICASVTKFGTIWGFKILML